jgi:hypothetical protein
MEGSKSGREAGATAEATAKPPKRQWLLRGGVIAVALLVALVAWLATRHGDDDDGSTAAVAAGPRIVSAEELSEAADSSGHPVYWASEIPGTELELSDLDDEGSRVRYVPAGTEAGQGSSAALTISSYPLADPGTALEGFADRPGAIVRQAADGREVVSSGESPTSVYFASPDNSVQVEIYDPSPQRAMNLALSGRVQPAP